MQTNYLKQPARPVALPICYSTTKFMVALSVEICLHTTFHQPWELQTEHCIPHIWHWFLTSPKGFYTYWAIQAGLLTPLTFAQHHLSPLAAFTSGSYFHHNGMR